MKKLLILLFSISLLWSPTGFADDISDFQIEGISIGDSLLDYMTEEEILEDIEYTKDFYYYLKEPNKYAEVYLYKNLKTYGAVSFFVKNTQSNNYITNKNEKYKILSIYGMMDFTENFNSCIVKRDEILEVVSEMFPNSDKSEYFVEYAGDPSGDSVVDVVYLQHESGAEIELSCMDYEETFRINRNWSDILNVAIKSEEVMTWMSDY